MKFHTDQKIMRALKRFMPSCIFKLVYLVAHSLIFGLSSIEKVLCKTFFFITMNKIEGDYFEFGVYEGDAFIKAYRLAHYFNLTAMRFYAFDSFQGLPDITGADANPYNVFQKGEWKCDYTAFRNNIAQSGLDESKVTIIPGWYHTTLTKETKKVIPARKAALILIDCDLYESTALALNFITDYVEDGTVIIFDDWNMFRGDPQYGEQRAFYEWLAKNPSLRATEYQKEGWSINSFILHKTTAADRGQ